MAFLKDTEREQLRQLVKACLLEISKLKIELKKCQNESSLSRGQERAALKDYKKEHDHKILEIQQEVIDLKELIKAKDAEIDSLRKFKKLFNAVTSKPKRDLTSFQTQIYLLLPKGESTLTHLYENIRELGFHELTLDNFEHAIRNLERKGYFKTYTRDEEVYWKKISKE